MHVYFCLTFGLSCISKVVVSLRRDLATFDGPPLLPLLLHQLGIQCFTTQYPSDLHFFLALCFVSMSSIPSALLLCIIFTFVGLQLENETPVYTYNTPQQNMYVRPCKSLDPLPSFSSFIHLFSYRSFIVHEGTLAL